MSRDYPDAGETGGSYRGMTTNERLYDAGLLDTWKRAVRDRDEKLMIELLTRVDVLPNTANKIVVHALGRDK